MNYYPSVLKPIALCALSLWTLSAKAVVFDRLDSKHSTLTFTSKQMNVPIEGQFKLFSAQLSIDPTAPSSGKASVEITMASIDAGSEEANKEVIGKDWFDVAHFPKAVFTSTEIKALEKGRYQLTGNLTIKGKTKKIAAPFTLKQNGPFGAFEGTFTIKRTDYGIGDGAWADPSIVEDNVSIHFRFIAAAKITTPPTPTKAPH